MGRILIYVCNYCSTRGVPRYIARTKEGMERHRQNAHPRRYWEDFYARRLVTKLGQFMDEDDYYQIIHECGSIGAYVDKHLNQFLRTH